MKQTNFLTLLLAFAFFVFCMAFTGCSNPQEKPLVFSKGFLMLEEVRKHSKLFNENEYIAYAYRYNQAAAKWHYRQPQIAQKYAKKFMACKRVLGKTRFFEIIKLVEKDYPFP